MEHRTFFGKPIREETTGMFYPQKISVEDFVKQVLEMKDEFSRNMNKLNIDREQYIEQWMETFCAWSEIEKEE